MSGVKGRSGRKTVKENFDYYLLISNSSEMIDKARIFLNKQIMKLGAGDYYRGLEKMLSTEDHERKLVKNEDAENGEATETRGGTADPSKKYGYLRRLYYKLMMISENFAGKGIPSKIEGNVKHTITEDKAKEITGNLEHFYRNHARDYSNN